LPTPTLVKYMLPVAPVPASRPRVTRRGHVYYGKNYTRFRTEAGKILETAVFPDICPIHEVFHLDVTFFCTRPRTTKKDAPRGDIDNYLKTLDVFNNILWKDDDLIRSVTARKEFSDEPRIELELKHGELRTT